VSLDAVLEGRRLVVCVGPGGVGKTTVSAAIGLAAARAGRKAFVLTIDPARRLADALGLDGLDDTTRRVPDEAVGDGGGELTAAMVDTGRSFDALIERITDDAAARERIFDNRVYQAVSRSLSRSHAYVAMERLYHAVTEESHDLVVLDTPPARNAIDILDAPAQLARFLDGRIVEWLLPGEGDAPKGIGARILARGGRMATGLLRRITGEELLDGILGFLAAFAELRPGFLARAQAVDAILREPTTAYVLVSSGSPSAVDDAAWLRDDLRARKIDVDAVVFNASYLPLAADAPQRILTSLPAADPAAGELATRLRRMRAEAAATNAAIENVVAGLRAELSSHTRVIRTPRFADEVRDLASLAALADMLRRPGTPG
jgi:anion-transporting  ArsA/GET3 family ATPase